MSRGTTKYRVVVVVAAFACLATAFGAGLTVGKRGVPFVGKEEQWSIGVLRGDSPIAFPASKGRGNPVLTAQDVTDVPAKFVADPFLVENDATWYLFFEVYNLDTQQGDIAVASSKNTRKWSYDRVVLDEPFHLSYPYVFRWQDEYYLIPESFEANSIRLYKAIDFPHQWSFVGTLVEGTDFVDPSIVRANDKWWIFVSSVSEPNSLRLYNADQLLGPWHEHPQSPVVTNKDDMARPAGRVLSYDGRILRYQQDLDSAWGHRVWAFEVTELTATGYAEVRLAEGPILQASGSGWNEKAMHHIDPHSLGDSKWIASVDGFGTYLVFGPEY
jgi:hypothetical protein